MEKLFLDIDRARHIQELGIDIEKPAFCWRRQLTGWDGKELREFQKRWSIQRNEPIAVLNVERFETVPAYSFQEIWEALPPFIVIEREGDKDIYWRNVNDVVVSFITLEGKQLKYFLEDSLVNSAYELLIWAFGEGYVK